MAKRKRLYSKTIAATTHQLPDAFLRVGPLMNLPQLVEELGCNPAPVFASLGFDFTQFADPDFEIPFIPASRLLSRCAAATGCDHLGLLLGERAAISSLGITGFLLQCAPTVKVALESLLRHLDLNERGGITTLVAKAGTVQLGYQIILPEASGKAQIYDLAMTYACRLMRSLCGQQWTPTELLMSRQPPRQLAPYRQVFKSRLRFNECHNALVFDADWLDQPIAGADPLLFQYLEQKAEDIHARHLPDIVDDLQILLRRSLAAQHCSVAKISRQLGMHERSLNRYLKAAGTSFRHELGRVRYELAREMLANSTMQAAQIADALDYADTTSFSRAFKHWSGLTPTDWRSAHRQPLDNVESPAKAFADPIDRPDRA